MVAIQNGAVPWGPRGNDVVTDSIPIQFIKINVFVEEDVHAVSAGDDAAVSNVANAGWKSVAQLEEYEWILVDSVTNLLFVFPAEKVILQHRHDDCRGMSIFVTKHLRARNGSASCIPILVCPRFSGQM
jgi:hypothetical protein